MAKLHNQFNQQEIRFIAFKTAHTKKLEERTEFALSEEIMNKLFDFCGKRISRQYKKWLNPRLT